VGFGFKSNSFTFIKTKTATKKVTASSVFGNRDALRTKFVENIEKIEVVLGRVEKLMGC
jgi:hypothetical protein